MRTLGTRARWAVPTGAAAVVGVVIAATTVASASEPSLPAKTAAQLLADVQQAKPLGPLTATVQETTNLGFPALPQLPALGQAGGLTPLAGTTTINIWYLNQQHVRIAEPQANRETDLRLNGNQLWLWDSKSQTATHVLLPKPVASPALQWSPAQSSSSTRSWSTRSSSTGSSSTQSYSSQVMISAAPSPLAAVKQLLADIGPSTNVKVVQNVRVAGRAAYQLQISPKASGSLIGRILIAVDAMRHVPLSVEVFARGASSPAVQVGYTALTFGRPAESNFAFTPPPGAHVKTVTVPGKAAAGGLPGLGLHGLGPRGLGLGALGLGGLLQLGAGYHASFGAAGAAPLIASGHPVGKQVGLSPAQAQRLIRIHMSLVRVHGAHALSKAAAAKLRANFIAHLPKNMTKAQRAAAIKPFDKFIARAQGKAGRVVSAPGNDGPLFPTAGGASSTKVLGKDWTSVVATAPSPAVAAAVQQLLSGPAAASPGASGGGFVGSSSSSASCPAASPGSATFCASAQAAPVGPDLAVLQALLKASTAVHGNWGSGRLLRTSLLSVLVTSNGRILLGAVTPHVLYTDAATLAR